MGFTLKNIIASLIMPLPLAFVIGVVGVILLFMHKERLAKTFLVVSFALLFLFSYNPVANSLLSGLESEHSIIKKVDKDIKYALLLGGNFQARAYGILEIYNQNRDIMIITSGYAGSNPISEAMKNKKALIKLGIPASHIIAIESARDTVEEAQSIKKELGGVPFYLVTSAYHMPRAYAIFKAHHTNPIAYPVGSMSKGIKSLSFISAKDAYKSAVALHEYIGRLWLKVKTIFY